MTFAPGLIPPEEIIASYFATASSLLSQETIFNFRVHLVEPLLCTLGSTPIRLGFSLTLSNAVFSRA
jgi:hypothetical protein